MAHLVPSFAKNINAYGNKAENKGRNEPDHGCGAGSETIQRETHLSEEIFKKAAKPLKYISEKQEITMGQSVMLALFVEFFFSRYNISLSDIAEKFDCSSSTILRFMNGIDGLEQHGIVYCARDGQHIRYRLPMEVIDVFRMDEKFVPKSHDNITCIELFLAMQDIFSMRTGEGLSKEILILATQYDFSGGQIENIARRHAIDGILNGESAHTLKKLMEHCDNERLEKRERKKVGV